jgi:hypothetical protein
MKFRQLPYRHPDPSRIIITSYYTALNDSPADPLEWESRHAHVLDSWDAAASLTVGVELTLDVGGILSDCRLPTTAALTAALLWESEGTKLRGCGSRMVVDCHLEQQQIKLVMRLDGSRLSQSLEVTPTVAVSAAVASPDRFAPRLPGTILWNSTRVIALGTEAARFPIEVQDFSQASNIFSPGASWFLDWDRQSFDSPLHGGLRLYINRSNPAVKRAVTAHGKPSEADSRLQEIIYFDTARSLITAALESEHFSDELDAYPPGSIGSYIQNLIAALFPQESLQSLKTMWEFNRWRFESMLQEALKLFQ